MSDKVNEYDGQHRVKGQDPEVPVSPNVAEGGDGETPDDDRPKAKVVVEGE